VTDRLRECLLEAAIRSEEVRTLRRRVHLAKLRDEPFQPFEDQIRVLLAEEQAFEDEARALRAQGATP